MEGMSRRIPWGYSVHLGGFSNLYPSWPRPSHSQSARDTRGPRPKRRRKTADARPRLSRIFPGLGLAFVASVRENPTRETHRLQSYDGPRSLRIQDNVTGNTGAREHTQAHTYTHTRGRGRARVASLRFVSTYASAIGEEPVLEVRKRTTTTHHRLATALLPLSAFPYKLRAAAVSLYPSAPLTLALSHTSLYRQRLYDRVTLYAVHTTEPIVRFAGGKHPSKR